MLQTRWHAKVLSNSWMAIEHRQRSTRTEPHPPDTTMWSTSLTHTSQPASVACWHSQDGRAPVAYLLLRQRVSTISQSFCQTARRRHSTSGSTTLCHMTPVSPAHFLYISRHRQICSCPPRFPTRQGHLASVASLLHLSGGARRGEAVPGEEGARAARVEGEAVPGEEGARAARVEEEAVPGEERARVEARAVAARVEGREEPQAGGVAWQEEFRRESHSENPE
jgi:hypothetical protein